MEGEPRRCGRDWMPAHPGMSKRDSDPPQTQGDFHDEFHATGLAYFNEAVKGGHFAAWEEPELFFTRSPRGVHVAAICAAP